METHLSPAAALEKLAKYEAVHAQLQAEQAQIAVQLEQLRAQGRQHSVQFRQLLGNKLMNASFLALLSAHGLG